MVSGIGFRTHAAFQPAQRIAQVQRARGACACRQAIKGRARLHERRHQAATLRVEDRHAEHALRTQRGQVRAILADGHHDRGRLKPALHNKARQEPAGHAVQLA